MSPPPLAELRPMTAPRPASGAPAVRRLGTVDYHLAWELQRDLVSERAAGAIPDTLLLLDHPPVITMGRAGHHEHLLAGAAELAARGVEYVETDRGGDVTFHGPGQIVGYPVVDLVPRGRDLHRYLRDVEQVLIVALAEFGLEGGREPGLTGVWVQGAKVAAIGVRVTRWIAHHGFALNVATDLASFDLIVPCGIEGRPVTSMEKLLGRAPDRAAVEGSIERAFLQIFAPVAA